MVYADASFLVSLYIPDNNSSRAKVAVASISEAIPFTALHALEVRNAFELGVFRQHFNQAAAQKAWSDLQIDLQSRRLIHGAVNWPTAFRFARWVSRRKTATLGVRSMDILHVACARLLNSTEFFSFDMRQRTLAATLGMHAKP